MFLPIRPHWIALQPEPAAQADWAEALRVWAWRALRVTPLVAQVDAALVLEVSASVRLFGGGAALLQALLRPWLLAWVLRPWRLQPSV